MVEAVGIEPTSTAAVKKSHLQACLIFSKINKNKRKTTNTYRYRCSTRNTGAPIADFVPFSGVTHIAQIG